MLRSTLVLALLVSTGLAAPVSAQFGAGCDSICADIFSNLMVRRGLPMVGLTAAVDGNTHGAGGGAFVQIPVGQAAAEGGIVAVVGDQSFVEEEFRSGGRLEPPRYIAVQVYVHGLYPVPLGGDSGPLSVYPLAGPRLYYWIPEGCEDNPEVFCEVSEVSFGLDLGVGAGYGPVRADVLTGIGGVPSISARLKLLLFSL